MPAEFPWTTISAIAATLVTLAGIVFAARGTRATSLRDNAQKNYDQLQEDNTAARDQLKTTTADLRLAERYITRLREFIRNVAKMDPPDWPSVNE